MAITRRKAHGGKTAKRRATDVLYARLESAATVRALRREAEALDMSLAFYVDRFICALKPEERMQLARPEARLVMVPPLENENAAQR